MLISLLHHLCCCFIDDVSLLALFFSRKPRSSSTATASTTSFPVFTILKQLMHRPELRATKARDALLHILQLARRNDELQQFILVDSDFCQMVAVGLSALYSALPSVLSPHVKGIWRLTGRDISAHVPELQPFLTTLEFCNSVARVASGRVVDRVMSLLYDGFLVSVTTPALLQASPAEAMAATAYLNLSLQLITDPKLMRPFIRFLLAPLVDVGAGNPRQRLADVIISRIEGKGELCLASLRILDTIVALSCEDVMLELCFRPIQARPWRWVVCTQGCFTTDSRPGRSLLHSDFVDSGVVDLDLEDF